MTPDQFWKLTPAELSMIIEGRNERYVQKRKSEFEFRDLLNGIHCALLANINRGPNTQSFKPADFMVTQTEVKPAAGDLNKKLQAWAAMSGAKHR